MNREVGLPKPKEKGATSIEEALLQRRSVRDYRTGALDLEAVSQVLWAGMGKNLHRRTAPSAGATYPLEVYLAAGEVVGLEPGLYRYVPEKNCLEKTSDQDLRARLSDAALGQRMIARAPVSIVIAAEYGRTTGRYGPRGVRYVHIEVGHVGQNICLQAIALGIGTVVIGAFDERRVREILGIPEEPLYIIPAGRIREVPTL